MDDTTETTEQRPPRFILGVFVLHLLASLLVDYFWFASLIGSIVTDGAVDFPLWLKVTAAVVSFPATLIMLPLLYSNSGMGWIAALVLVPLNSVFWGWLAARIKYRRRRYVH